MKVSTGEHARRLTLKLKAIGASPGVAVGQAFVLDRKRVRTPKLRLADAGGGAGADAVQDRDRAVRPPARRAEGRSWRRATGTDHALILEAHRLMLHDPMLVDEVNKLIAEEQINAEWAVRRVARKIKHLFDNIPDEYFRERRADVDFVADRVVRNLLGQVVDVEEEVPAGGGHRRARPLAGGRGDAGADAGGWRPSSPTWAGQTSHTAIVARARETPAVVGAGRA